MHVSEGPDKLLVPQGAEYCSDNKPQPQTGPLWEKVLWKQQPFPDSYTPPSFLVELVVNAAVPRRQYWPVVLSSCAITQQLAVMVASCAVAAQLKAGILDATHLLLTCTLLMTAGYITCAALGGHLLGGSLVRGARQGALLVGGVACLSPMLRTLAATIATDSIIALSVALMTAHLFLHDYNFVNSVTDRLSGALALAAAVLASVLLSSTMPSELHVFAQVLFSLLSFMLSPFVRRYIRAASASCHVVTTAGLVCAAAWLLVPLSLSASSLFMACVFVLTFVCPALLVSIHKYKAKINGPWDEAVPHIPRHLHLPPVLA
ncbi:phosphatidylinositol N-acetylglucosaminyltransferase subunit C [Haematococcus lacustris]